MRNGGLFVPLLQLAIRMYVDATGKPRSEQTELVCTYLKFAGHVVGGVHHVSGDEHVETGDDGQRDRVVDEKLEEHHGLGIGGPELVRERVTGFE